MKFMKRGFIVVFLVIVLLISGCTQISNLPKPNIQLGQNSKQIVESKGLSIKFRDNQPPLNEIFSGKDFKISLELTNNDPEEVSGTIYLSDTPSDEFSSLEGREQQSFSVPAAEVISEGSQKISKLIPSSEIITFGPYNYNSEKAFPGMVTNFILEITTKHNVLIPAQICVSSREQSKCPTKETVTNFGPRSGYSPVSITSIEKTLVPEEGNTASLILKINIKNTGKGKIDNEEQILNSFDLNLRGASNLDCNKNKISLKQQENQVICTAEVSVSDELFRQDILEINYDYPYKIIETLGPIRVTKLEI